MIPHLRKNIDLLKSGELSEEEFARLLEKLPYENLGNIKLDFHRPFRRGLPEVIYGREKSTEQLKKIVQKFKEKDEEILITKVNGEAFKQLEADFEDLVYHEKAGIVTFNKPPKVRFKSSILILSAGASDEAVAEEAYISSLYLGNRAKKEYDVGVACLARVLDLREEFNRHGVIIVVAGMEGALPSVVAGLTSTPVIGVPTSVGYGANFNGVSALLSMLNACAGGVSVVNIDNGFGAAYQATLISQKISGASKSDTSP